MQIIYSINEESQRILVTVPFTSRSMRKPAFNPANCYLSALFSKNFIRRKKTFESMNLLSQLYLRHLRYNNALKIS